MVPADRWSIHMCMIADNIPDLTNLQVQAHVVSASANQLQPQLWLDAAFNYTRPFQSDNRSCGQYQANREPECVTFNSRDATVSMQGSFSRPMRFTEALQGPLRIRAVLQRDVECSGQYLILSRSPVSPSYPGEQCCA